MNSLASYALGRSDTYVKQHLKGKLVERKQYIAIGDVMVGVRFDACWQPQHPDFDEGDWALANSG